MGIGYDDSIAKAQEVALAVLAEHPAILRDPEPWVLADSLGKATVNLRVYFWLNGKEHSWLKVRSSAIRLVKMAFQKNGISMPDEAREIIFPQGVPIVSQETDSRNGEDRSKHAEPEAISTDAEASLVSEAHAIRKQASAISELRSAENLLREKEAK